MSENKESQSGWAKAFGDLKKRIQTPIDQAKAKVSHAIESGKEKANFFVEASKNVLQKELKKISQLPNIGKLGEAAFGLAATGIALSYMVAPLTEGLIKMATTGTSVAPPGSPEQTAAIIGLGILDAAHIALTTEFGVITFNRIKQALSPSPIPLKSPTVI